MTLYQKVTPLWPQNTPDFDRLRRVLLRQELPDRVPFIELFADPEIVAAVLGEKPIYPSPEDQKQRQAALRQRIRFCQTAGYDYVWAYPGVFHRDTALTLVGEDTAELPRPQRAWVNESEGVIATMEDFENFPWPTPETVDYSDLEFVAQHLPEGMQMIAATSGVLEWVMWLMGFAPFALALHDQPELVEAMFQRIGDLFAAIYETLVDMPKVGALFLGDDMGYKTGPFISPEQLRHYVFPRQRRLVEITHSRDLPFLLHACGNLRLVMDDLIDYVGIDGKHSYEDTHLPATEAKLIYGDRIAILGGVDVDMLTRSSEEEVRAYTRRVLEDCMPDGGYALGTGNTVANYIPVRNYLAMLDEGMKVGSYR
jgi:uroporphyrinogen decarboxylase